MSARDSGTYIELDEAWGDPGWTRVPNTIARCPTISRRLKGWILEVSSHEPGRRLTFTDMLATSKDGRDATYATIKEGLDAGFITRHQGRDDSGRMGIVVYRVHVSSQNPRSAPLPGSPDTVEPVTENPETSKKTKSSLEDYKKQETTKPPCGRSEAKPHAAVAAAETSEASASSGATSSQVSQPPRHDHRQDVERLCMALRDHMIANDCRPPAITQAWRDAARLMLDKDGRQVDEALDLLSWVVQDEFWRANILSMPKFRTRYDQLRLRWLQTNPVRHLRSTEAVTHWLRQQWRDGDPRQVSDRSGLRYEAPPVLPVEVKNSEQANVWHEQQVRKWIEINHKEIVRRIVERETPAAEVAS